MTDRPVPFPLEEIKTVEAAADWFDAAVAGRHPRILAAERAAVMSLARAVLPDLIASLEPGQQIFLSASAWLIDRVDRIGTLRTLKRSREAQISFMTNPRDRRAAILEFAGALGASPRQLRGDRRAFRAWFDLDAVVGRADRQIGEAEQAITIGLDRIGAAARALATRQNDDFALAPEAVSALQHAMERILRLDPDPRVTAAVFDCLALMVSNGGRAAGTLATTLATRVTRLCLMRTADVGLRIAALSCLWIIAPATAPQLSLRLLTAPDPPQDEFWVQRGAVRNALCQPSQSKAWEDIVETAATHSSPAVRQIVALAEGDIPDVRAQAILSLTDDTELTVRLAALSRLPALLCSSAASEAADAICVRLTKENDPIALRLLFEISEAECLRLAEGQGDPTIWAERVVPLLEHHHVSAENSSIRRRAAEAREGIWCASNPEASALCDAFMKLAAGMAEGDMRRLPRAVRKSMGDPDFEGRVLAVLARRDFGLSLTRAGWSGTRLGKGERFRRRLWRLIHEALRPGTEKRQAFRHTIARDLSADLTAPSAILAELAQTKVPGEPLFIEAEQGWRNYLPLPDHFVSSVEGSKSLSLYSSEGVTVVEPPQHGLRRLRARASLALGFSRFAELRNSGAENAYVTAFRQLGFQVTFRPHAGTSTDDRVSQCFSFSFLPFLPALAGRWQDYYYSIYQNTLTQLAIFLALSLGWFAGRHLVLSRRMRRVRDALPLVIGGWGTRGKSGTERLKAAMLNGIGLPLVSKTTGCEAMFLHADAFGTTQEMFLFRPFDKATIWEQAHVAKMGRDLGSSAVLWECMGLTPAYVSILQRQWMRDDLSTITNTYPDHEDLQGPAGRNIPEVMCEFIPDNGILLTTEEQMLPILREGAKARGTELVSVDWLQAAMLPLEALKRFPYDEHPANIALVLRLADALGIDRDRALREMADRVVADLGVLKTYPVAKIGARRLEFVNGMSANERFGALGNWRRTGYAEQDMYGDPGTYLVTVVNNRADRVPRSRVFAQILVDDFMADRHVLIGSNLKGLKGFIDEAWQERIARFSLSGKSGAGLSPEEAVEQVIAEIRRLRIAYLPDHVRRIAGALANTEPPAAGDVDALPEWVAARMAEGGAGAGDAEAVVAHLRTRMEEMREAESLLEAVRSGRPDATLEDRCREAFGVWFWRKFVTVEDYFASGEDVVGVLAGLAPPNYMTRVMGIQNIKGTGLGFVYAWQHYDAFNAACLEIESGDPARAQDGLRSIEAGPPPGTLGRDRLAAALSSLECSASPEFLATASARIERLREATETTPGSAAKTSAVKSRWPVLDASVNLLEGALDVFAAIRRRRIADKVYRDLAAQRISRPRAAQVIQSLNAHQKGGWLWKWLERRFPGRAG